MAAILADDILKRISLNENDIIPISRSPIDNKAALVQRVALCGTGDRPLSEPVMTQFIDAYMRH